ncbi:MAG TPA: hypothetical protein VFZ76_14165 [Anaerolineales bacterium]
MGNVDIREQLHKQIENLPDDVVEQIADFAMFIMAKRQISPDYEDWDVSQWQDFALAQLFRDEDEVEYSLQDAEEIYKS